MIVVVCGGGVAGHSVALLLHRRGHEVTLLERDGDAAPRDATAAWELWKRPGIPQLRQFHAFSALARRTLRHELPDVHAALLEAGFSEHSAMARMPFLFPDSAPVPGDEEVVNLFGRRATFEWVLRRAVEDSGMHIRLGCSADGVMSNGTEVTGVRCDGAELRADLVVDATGRRSASERWLGDAGLPTGDTFRSETGIVYYSRWYRLRPGVDLDGNAVRIDLGWGRAMLTPADDGFVSLAISVGADDDALKALRRASVFQAVADALPMVGELLRSRTATPASEILFMGGLRNRHRRLLDTSNEAIIGFVAVGDAATITNPVYGRGVALAVSHAATLARVLDEANELADATNRFARETEEVLRPWWDLSTREDDLRKVWLRFARGADLSPLEEELLAGDDARAHRALTLAMTRDPRLFRLVVRNLTSLDPPDRLHNTEVARHALSLMGRDELTAVPMSRTDLLATLASA